MAVQLAKSFGAEVTLFTTSEHKIDDGYQLGADTVILSKDNEAMTQLKPELDLILNPVSTNIDLDPYFNTLKRDGTLVLLGLPSETSQYNAGSLIFKRRQLAGSLIGGIQETQEMLDYCHQHKITAQIETINMDNINHAYERMLKSDVKYRFVIDCKTI